MSLVNNNQKASMEAITEELQKVKKELAELTQKVSNSNLRKRTKDNSQQKRPITRVKDIHVFDFEEDSEHVYIALIEESNDSTSSIIQVSKKTFNKLIKEIITAKVKTVYHIKDFILTENVGIKIDNEWMMSE